MRAGRSLRLGRCAGLSAVVAAGLALLAGCGASSSPEAEVSFDAQRSWDLVRLQVAAGQRPAGSPQLRKLAEKLVKMLPDGRFEPIPGDPGLRNIVGRLPGTKPAIVIGAHYDTLTKPKGFVGANNGAAGSAIVIEVARALEAAAPAPGREIQFVLFDGEEPPAGLPGGGTEFYSEGLRGSRAYVEAHAGDSAAMILLDYVGHRGLLLPREGSSTTSLWEQLLGAARSAGASRFFSAEAGPVIIDDHTPFLRAGVPAVDLIDWRYPGHSRADGLEKISLASLDGVGETVARLALELRAG